MPITPRIVLQTPCASTLACLCAGQVVVDGNMTIPPEKPDIEQVMDFSVSAEVTEWKEIMTPLGPKVIASGSVRVVVRYVGLVPSQSVHVAHFDFPWHTFFLCEAALPADVTICGVTACVEVAEFHVLDPRTVEKMVILAACATACPPPEPCPECP